MAVLGQSAVKKLYRVGERTAPCGTPLRITLLLEWLVRYWQCEDLPRMKAVSHRIMFGWRWLLLILSRRVVWCMLSKALL